MEGSLPARCPRPSAAWQRAEPQGQPGPRASRRPSPPPPAALGLAGGAWRARPLRAGHGPWGEARMGGQGPGQHSPDHTAPGGDSPPGCRQGFSGLRSGGFCCGKPADQRPGHCSALGAGSVPGDTGPAEPSPRPVRRTHSSPPPGPHLCTRSTRWAISLSEMPGQDSGQAGRRFSSSLQRPTPAAARLVLLLAAPDTPRHLTGGQGGAPAHPTCDAAAGGSAAPLSPRAPRRLPGRAGLPACPGPWAPSSNHEPSPNPSRRSSLVPRCAWSGPASPAQPGHWD